MSYIVLYANGEKFTPTIQQMLVGTTDGTNQSWFIDDVWGRRQEDNSGRYHLDTNCDEVQHLARHLGISTTNWKDLSKEINAALLIEKETRQFLWVSKEVELYYFCTDYDQVEFNCQLFYLEQ